LNLISKVTTRKTSSKNKSKIGSNFITRKEGII